MSNSPDNNRKEQAKPEGGKFKPGMSGNPSGRPVGSKSIASRLVNDMIAERAEEIANVLIANAIAGDSACLKLAVERLAPAPKDNKINIALPTIENTGDLNKAISQVIGKVANGEITPLEGQTLVKMFEVWKSAFNLEEVVQRINKLEEHANAQPGR